VEDGEGEDEERSLYSRALCASTHGKLGAVEEDQRSWGLFRRLDRKSLAAFLDTTFITAVSRNGYPLAAGVPSFYSEF
jgi:hypothetical protein